MHVLVIVWPRTSSRFCEANKISACRSSSRWIRGWGVLLEWFGFTQRNERGSCFYLKLMKSLVDTKDFYNDDGGSHWFVRPTGKGRMDAWGSGTVSRRACVDSKLVIKPIDLICLHVTRERSTIWSPNQCPVHFEMHTSRSAAHPRTRARLLSSLICMIPFLLMLCSSFTVLFLFGAY
jgi:hypothetical protein